MDSSTSSDIKTAAAPAAADHKQTDAGTLAHPAAAAINTIDCRICRITAQWLTTRYARDPMNQITLDAAIECFIRNCAAEHATGICAAAGAAHPDAETAFAAFDASDSAKLALNRFKCQFILVSYGAT